MSVSFIFFVMFLSPNLSMGTIGVNTDLHTRVSLDCLTMQLTTEPRGFLVTEWNKEYKHDKGNANDKVAASLQILITNSVQLGFDI